MPLLLHCIVTNETNSQKHSHMDCRSPRHHVAEKVGNKPAAVHREGRLVGDISTLELFKVLAEQRYGCAQRD